MNPQDIAHEINSELREQTRRLRQVDENRCPHFGSMLDHYKFTSDPYLESITYYAQDAQTTLEQLQKEKTSNGEAVLEEETALLFAAAFGQPGHPEKIRLYRHQADAIRSAREGKHLVICTGTGSGKTESFLIPLLNDIIRERKYAREKYQEGVRALILYPMNALVNDQLRRIRSILRFARGIPYASDISFGRYTGELTDQKKVVIRNAAFADSVQHTDNVDFSGNLHYPYLSEEEAGEKEIVNRRTWERHPGDILITNYSMLEQLMLDPQRAGIFCRNGAPATWKYIVVDEAHYYDGSLGTDIAWLMRRVTYRCQSHKLQYIATSATLVDDSHSAGMTKDEYIRKEFASKLFPIPPSDEIEVLLGSPYRRPLPQTALRKDAGYADIIENHDGLSELYAMIVAAIRSEDLHFNIDGVDKNPWDELLLSELPPSATLFDITRWYLDTKRWSRRWTEFTPGAAVMTIGECAHLARIVAGVVPDYKLVFEREGTALGIHELMENHSDASEYQDILKSVSGEPSDSRVISILAIIEQWQKDEQHQAISANLFTLLAEFVQELYHRLSGTPRKAKIQMAKPELPPVATWILKWNEACINELCILKAQADKIEQLLQTVEQELNRLWCKRLADGGGAFDAAIPSFTHSLTQFYVQRVHLERMHVVLDAAIRADNALSRTHGHVRESVFPPDEIADESQREKEFSAFVQMLSLTSHPELYGKPLMDIRYHQLVHGIHSVSICLKKTSGGVEAFFFPDCEDLTLSSEEDGQKHQLYSMGVCYACGEPYLLGFAKSLNGAGEKYSFSRYADSGENGAGMYCALSWLEPQEASAPEEENCRWWFDLKHSVLSKEAAHSDHSAEPHMIRIYAVEQANGDRRRLERCPICKATSTESVAEEGIIAPFKTGAARARTTIMSTMIRKADADFACGTHKARGRKLLAFSDSRSAAAKLAINYARFEEERLLERSIAECLKNGCEVETALCTELDIAAQNHLFKNAGYEDHKGKLGAYCTGETWDPEALHRQIAHALEEQNFGEVQRLAACLEALGHREAESPLKNSLLTLMYQLRSKLKDISAESVSHKEYQDNRETKAFSDFAGYSLAALSALRNRGSKGLLKLGELRVHSYSHRTKGRQSGTWQQILKRFTSEEQAERFLCFVLTDLFLRGNVSAEQYDKNGGRDYEHDLERSLCGFDGFNRKHIVKVYAANMPADERSNSLAFMSQNGQGKYERELLKDNYLQPGGTARDVLIRIWDYLNQGTTQDPETKLPRVMGISLIRDGKLDLDDLRFSLANADGFLQSLGENDGCRFFRVEEHSAQISAAQGRMHQELFAAGSINILSCSTTFEMGVDLGNLNCVFLNNIAPSPANYCQRAGRAGRRPGSVSYVLTYIGDSPHDQYYRAAPHKLFFGPVVPPRLYPENVTFRSKHLRAEALYHFLSTYDKLNIAWKKSGNFFLGQSVVARHRNGVAQEIQWEIEQNPCILDYMKEWACDESRSGELNERCQKIRSLGMSLPPEPLGYDVAADLYFQICGYDGDMSGCIDIVRHPKLIQELSGPNLNREAHNVWAAPARKRYQLKRESFDTQEGIPNTLRRTLDEMTTSVLSSYRVLPRYGFPCDVVSLLPHPSERKTVDLNRSATTGIFEYAPGQSVIANKRCYTSARPVFYAYPHGQPQIMAAEGPEVDVVGGAEYVYHCRNCRSYFLKLQENIVCPTCGATRTGGDNRIDRIPALAPDGFEANRSTKAVGFAFNRGQARHCLYSGGITNKFIHHSTKANLRVDESRSRSILYLNDTTKHNRGGQRQIWNNVALMHSLRTDIVLWSPANYGENAPFLDEPERQAHAWESALQAVLRAAADILHIIEGDFDGIVSALDSGDQRMRPAMVLFDCSSSGAGAVLPLMVSDDEETVYQLSTQILHAAIDLCRCGKCRAEANEDAGKAPASHEVVLAQGDHPRNRDYRSCYHCLRSYDNQRMHPTLDVYDAEVILRYLLTPCGEADAPKDSPAIRTEGTAEQERRLEARRRSRLLEAVKADQKYRCRVLLRRAAGEAWGCICGHPNMSGTRIKVRFDGSEELETIEIENIIKEG